MTTQAEELLGARVSGADGKVVGTVEQVFRDDVDGTPAWARVRAGRSGRFVPLGSSQVTSDGLNVPFDSQKIMAGPNIEAGQHMSAGQAEELSRYYGLAVPTQQTRRFNEPAMQQQPSQPMDRGGDWLVRQEERIQVGKEMIETGRVRLHKYVDVEPIEQAVRLYREEYDIERAPIRGDERISGNIGEGVQEVVLHEERPVLRKELVPVERVRLMTRRIEQDATVREEIRRERIEIEPDQQFASNRGGNQGFGNQGFGNQGNQGFGNQGFGRR